MKGSAHINLWNDNHFVNTTVSNGVMNFNNQAFNLATDMSFALQSQDARANFNGGLLVNSGGMLDVGLGSVFASNFTAQAGSSLGTFLQDDGAGVTNGLITGDALTFETGLTWTLAGTATNVVEQILLASATTALTNDLVSSDFDYTSPQWWRGIADISTNAGGLGINLYAAVGDLSWDAAFDAPEGSEYEKALQDLSSTVTNGTAGFDLLTGIASQADAQAFTFNGTVRTPEMANTLMGLQSLFSDQIKDRTRSHLRLKGWGGTATHSPMGAAGPDEWYQNSKDWMGDHMPFWDARGASRQAADAAYMPEVKGDPSSVGKPYMSSSAQKGSDYDAVKERIEELVPAPSGEKIEVPPTYQVWGRGYGSYLDQKGSSDHAGYDASIAGGMLGVDKRFENMLLGIGGGYARTILNGDAGNDGTANTGHAVGYFSANKEKLYLDANLNYAFNAVETEYFSSVGGYSGDYSAHTVGFFLGGGYGMSAFNDKLLFVPEVSILSTYYNRDAYTDTSTAMPDKMYDSYDQWSYLGSLGATLSMIQQIESFNLEMEFQP
ncbi:MAG: autotransporter outer membrane beta-barrel domain-containing protein, partial [Verrucomicrobiota bacterium]|nr:autotransporter outer membrane beta-barrel domain-containing protein [Verrucomicrobiota bacterium]